MTKPAQVARRALGFLSAEADAPMQCCAQVIVGAQSAAVALESLFGKTQTDPDPFRMWQQLGILDDIGALASPHAERICARLSQQQCGDGSWDVAGADSDSDAARIPATGMIAGHLAKTPFVRERVLAAAADFLVSLWEPDRVKGDAWAVTAAYAHCFSLIRHHESDPILQWCGRELQRGLVTGVYDAVQFARVHSLCRAHGLPGAPILREELVERLCGEQREDGSFGRSDDRSTGASVLHTFAALVALVRLTGAA